MDTLGTQFSSYFIYEQLKGDMRECLHVLNAYGMQHPASI